MKLRIFSLSVIATGLLVGCNPDPRPNSMPASDATPIAEQPRTPADADADTLIVYMNRVTPDEVGASAGTITVTQRGDDLVFSPNLMGLNPGKHGFHIHQNPSCEPEVKDGKKIAAAAAGGHYDPTDTGQHTGPDGNGHKGDLPMLEVDDMGVQQDVTMPGLTLNDLQNRALVVHQGQDDYSTNPAGASGPRIACGVID
ncbi:superoxide dismutase family protein [Arsukibacterium sp. UBA3155]|uniref:superoxide dismutase family protein n=1 Tax=Arsukibacterium sp. UBA3155 TaxID=1946058 RepID=UPI0025BA2674|nr:superoxide dismutase family protein [Arsukibacterium sp. UBA3155]|tara:strand:- start:77511 stop:78107 length:597 start_codon:yes stop_codon:yes gene_type:complete